MAFVPTSRHSQRHRPSLGERATTARVAVSSVVGRASSALSLSPVLRWRQGRVTADALVIAPRDLRNADPTFASELAKGELGLSGCTVPIRPSAWEAPVRTDACRRELHGFGWLRHVTASDDATARAEAAALIGSWISRYAARSDDRAWDVGVAARRTLAWLSHGPLVLEDAEPRAYDAFAEALGRHLVFLGGAWTQGADGYPRILAAIARLAGDVCFDGRDRQLARSASDLARELERQIDGDGIHVTRNPDVLIEILIDLLPVVHAVRSRNQDLPPAIADAIARAMKMVRHLRIGGTRLARFNGGGNAGAAVVAAVLGYDPSPDQTIETPIAGGYVRLAGGRMQALMDAGSPPPAPFAGRAHAGTLAFEMAIGADLVFVNAGAPADIGGAPGSAARATDAHTTLVLGERSSAMLLKNPVLERIAGGAPLTMGGRVNAAASTTDDLAVVEASHEGYCPAFGLVHHRRVAVRADGSLLSGVDRLSGPSLAPTRLARDVPLAIRFHLATGIDIAGGPWPDAVDLRLPTGQVWRFAASGALLSIEESPRFDAQGGGRLGLQVVLRGTTFGESEIRWEFSPRIGAAAPLDDLSAAIAAVTGKRSLPRSQS